MRHLSIKTTVKPDVTLSYIDWLKYIKTQTKKPT